MYSLSHYVQSSSEIIKVTFNLSAILSVIRCFIPFVHICAVHITCIITHNPIQSNPIHLYFRHKPIEHKNTQNRPTFDVLSNGCQLYLHAVFSAGQHICLARYMLSPVRPSVSLSVTRVDQSKTVEITCRIMRLSSQSSAIPLVFAV